MAAVSKVAPFRSAELQARLSTGFLAAYVAGNALFTVAKLSGVSSSNVLIAAAGLAFLAVVGGTIVTICLWTYRVVGNMASLGVSGSPWTAASAVAWCFVPFGFLVQPMWSVLDAWRGADTSAHRIDLGSRMDIKTPRVLIAWWLTWALTVVCILIGSRARGAAASWIGTIAAVGFTAAALLCLLVIRDVTEREQRKHQLIVSGQLV